MRILRQWVEALLVVLVLAVTLILLASPISGQGVPRDRIDRRKVVSTPAVSNQATASIAGVANLRHVADCVAFSAGSTTAPALTALTVNLRDGATGAGTVLASWQVIVPAGTGQNVVPFAVCGLNLPGTANTAMTLEFSALLTNLLESTTLTYYDTP